MLLERQTVIFCPNVGVLTSVVLALIPLVRPFAWQSLLLPILPATEDMLDLLQVCEHVFHPFGFLASS